MRFQKTRRHKKLHRKTHKKSRVYGGTKLSASAKPFVLSSTTELSTPKLRANAPSFIPSQQNLSKPKLRANAPSFIPPRNNSTVTINEITDNLSNLSIPSDNYEDFEQYENAVAIDCEMVGVGYQSVLAHVAIVDFNGNEIYNKYVIPRSGLQSITNYRTSFSGITPSTLRGLDKKTHGFKVVRDEVRDILDGKTIVGHGLINDFKVLEYNPEDNMVWDTTQIEKYMQNSKTQVGKKQARKLKVIAKEFANNNIQSELKDGHSPVEDARASMNLYRVEMGYPKVVYENMSRAF
jgi:RNA exonuclease 4